MLEAAFDGDVIAIKEILSEVISLANTIHIHAHTMCDWYIISHKLITSSSLVARIFMTELNNILYEPF